MRDVLTAGRRRPERGGLSLAGARVQKGEDGRLRRAPLLLQTTRAILAKTRQDTRAVRAPTRPTTM